MHKAVTAIAFGAGDAVQREPFGVTYGVASAVDDSFVAGNLV